jgi:hypothetical protein
MFRVTMCPSSGEITVLVLQLVFATEFGWSSVMHPAYQSTQYKKMTKLVRTFRNCLKVPKNGRHAQCTTWRRRVKWSKTSTPC